MRVGRLATMDDEAIHLVPICPVLDGGVFYVATHAKSRKVRNVRKNNKATLLIDEYAEDWTRLVAAMMTGTVEIIESGPEFEKAKQLLEAKYQQYHELFPIHEGESVIFRFKPIKAVKWDYILEETTESH
jgi:nitroimidazol reductase NimA-like FMN-containing flavoprotein (pyridoxamine 5'-phosphate oxidase superfamily)